MAKIDFSTFFPSFSNGIDCFAGVFTTIGIVIMGYLYIGRKRNQIFLLKYFGFPKKAAEIEAKLPQKENKPFEPVIIWHNVLLFAMCHMGAVLGIYLFITVAKWKTLVWAFVIWQAAFFTIPGGCHRLYAHNAFKGSKLYEIVVMILNSMLMHNSMIHWARDHRVHHKFVDTNADPTNINRGLFFAHIGWLMVEKHPEVIEKGKKLDYSDLYSNPILKFQKDYYGILIFIFNMCIPGLVPVIFWEERFWTAFFCCINFVWCMTLNCVGFVNSLCHYQGETVSIGTRPYNKNISPADGDGPWSNILTFGEGHHNFHHTFPQDYRSSEHNSFFLFATHVIDICSWFGLTYGFKVMPKDLVERRKTKNDAELKLDF